MSSEWGTVRLCDVAKEVTVGFVGTMANEYVETGIPFLRSLNVDRFRINDSDIKYVTEEFHRKISKSRLTPGDVVIVRITFHCCFPDDNPDGDIDREDEEKDQM